MVGTDITIWIGAHDNPRLDRTRLGCSKRGDGKDPDHPLEGIREAGLLFAERGETGDDDDMGKEPMVWIGVDVCGEESPKLKREKKPSN